MMIDGKTKTYERCTTIRCDYFISIVLPSLLLLSLSFEAEIKIIEPIDSSKYIQCYKQQTYGHSEPHTEQINGWNLKLYSAQMELPFSIVFWKITVIYNWNDVNQRLEICQ